MGSACSHWNVDLPLSYDTQFSEPFFHYKKVSEKLRVNFNVFESRGCLCVRWWMHSTCASVSEGTFKEAMPGCGGPGVRPGHVFIIRK